MRKPYETVVVALYGGLGNQLFQYAAGLTLARRWGVEKLRFCYRTSQMWPTGNPTLSSVLPMDAGSPIDRRILPRIPSALAWALADLPRSPMRAALARAGVQLVDDRHAAPPKRVAPSALLHGHFQSWPWVEDVVAEIAAELHGRLLREPGCDRWLAEPYTAVHFRRSDYLRIGWELEPGYYRRAMESVGASSGSVRVLSDDPGFALWVSSALRLEGLDVRSGEEPTGRPLSDLAMLSMAPRAVLANSSFSWWAGVTGDQVHPPSQRRVAYPLPWVPIVPAMFAPPHWRAIPTTFLPATATR